MNAAERRAEVFAEIKEAAERGLPCPTGGALAGKCSCSTGSIDNALMDLEERGLIHIERIGRRRRATIVATGARTAVIGGAHGEQSQPSDRLSPIHPRVDLAPGRYVLDEHGRLHPFRHKAIVRAICAVTVRCKAPPAPNEAPLSSHDVAPSSKPVRQVLRPAKAPERATEPVVPNSAVQVIEPEREIDWSRAANAHRSLSPASPKSSPPRSKAEHTCGYCKEPHESVRHAGGTCTYCKAVGDAL